MPNLASSSIKSALLAEKRQKGQKEQQNCTKDRGLLNDFFFLFFVIDLFVSFLKFAPTVWCKGYRQCYFHWCCLSCSLLPPQEIPDWSFVSFGATVRFFRSHLRWAGISLEYRKCNRARNVNLSGWAKYILVLVSVTFSTSLQEFLFKTSELDLRSFNQTSLSGTRALV